MKTVSSDLFRPNTSRCWKLGLDGFGQLEKTRMLKYALSDGTQLHHSMLFNNEVTT